MTEYSLRLSFELLWTISRSHEWTNSWIDEDAIARDGLATHMRGDVTSILLPLREEPYIEYHSSKGYRIKNDPDSQAQAAFRCREILEHSELRIEATFSRFDDVGGFDEYDKKDVIDDLPEIEI